MAEHIRIETLPGGRHVEGIEIRSAESTARGLLHRQARDPVQSAIGREASH